MYVRFLLNRAAVIVDRKERVTTRPKLEKIRKIKTKMFHKNGWTAIVLASQGGHLDCIKYLVGEGGADVNAADKDGWTAVMQASA